ncbi:MAG: hypothetical protein KIY10_05365 [Thermoplasmata archaeon]|nr:hypothetical protein [Candidatus Sysuiplasma jiujiangense]MBX8641986.1 hypothetical protein [Candidatus Sysuiplasma jiujiangense]
MSPLGKEGVIANRKEGSFNSGVITCSSGTVAAFILQRQTPVDPENPQSQLMLNYTSRHIVCRRAGNLSAEVEQIKSDRSSCLR